MRKKIIAGNWKMNLNNAEARAFAIGLHDFLKTRQIEEVIPIICPSFVSLTTVASISEGLFEVGAQDVSAFKDGAYTGEISVNMLKAIGLEYCIIGHSERRKYHSETDRIVNLKLKQLQQNGIQPIVCIGETLEQREEGITENVILKQLESAFSEIELNSKIFIAYEPIWAIGTGKTATPQQAQEIHSLIRDWISKKYSKNVSNDIHILYGGSVKPENIKDLLSQKDIDGGLIGGASLSLDKYIEMLKIASKM